MQHLAQINLARMVAPLEDPVMAGFVAQLDAVNAAADRSEGFVWRLQGDAGDATAVRVLGDPAILVNMSVWSSAESLLKYVYQSGHGPVLRDRARWFSRMTEAHLALWWIPAGTPPTVDEALRRLQFLRAHGETPFAFTFRRRFEAPSADVVRLLDGRVLRTEVAAPGGDCTSSTMFTYRVSDDGVHATYEGGGVRDGRLQAEAREGVIAGHYGHVTDAGEPRAGECEAIPELLADGRLRVHESWRWTHPPEDVRRYSALIEAA
jgi:hypothetical protein